MRDVDRVDKMDSVDPMDAESAVMAIRIPPLFPVPIGVDQRLLSMTRICRYKGMLPCLRNGARACLPSSTCSERISRRRVLRG